MMEYYIDRTTSLYAAQGEVYIDFKDAEDGEVITLVYNARELLKDIPSLYSFAKSAEEQEDTYYSNKYREFTKELKEDFQRPVGRPPKE